MAEPLVQLIDAGKTYAAGAAAVDRVDLTLADGEFVSLLGPSGCGKSTILRMIAGLTAPTRGAVHRFGNPRRGTVGPSIGCVFQDPTLLPWSSVWDNVYLPLRLAGVNRVDARNRVDEALRLVGLADFARAAPRQLSGGMRMRAALARSLATRPRLLLLDEPLAALDEITRNGLSEELHDLWCAHRWTALFITHSVVESVYLSTRVLVMSPRPGRIVDDIPIELPSERTDAIRTTPHFVALCRRVSASLHSAMDGRAPHIPLADVSSRTESSGERR